MTQAEMELYLERRADARHWYNVAAPALFEEAKQIQVVIQNILALRDSANYQDLGLPTIVKMWEKQYQSLKLFGEGCVPPVEAKVAAILAERRVVMTELLRRLCAQEGAEYVNH